MCGVTVSNFSRGFSREVGVSSLGVLAALRQSINQSINQLINQSIDQSHVPPQFFGSPHFPFKSVPTLLEWHITEKSNTLRNVFAFGGQPCRSHWTRVSRKQVC